MNRLILQLLAVGFCFAFVHSLTCYECKFGFGELCITTQKVCASGQHCFSGEGKAAGFLPIKMKGCLSTSMCNSTKEEEVPMMDNSTIYTMTKTCCNTDLCNAAPGLPGSSGLSLVLTAMSALFVTKVLV